MNDRGVMSPWRVEQAPPVDVVALEAVQVGIGLLANLVVFLVAALIGYWIGRARS